jgi:hypothetical protein
MYKYTHTDTVYTWVANDFILSSPAGVFTLARFNLSLKDWSPTDPLKFGWKATRQTGKAVILGVNTFVFGFNFPWN